MTNKQDWVDLSHHFSNPKIRSIFSYRTFPSAGIKGRKDLARQTGFDPDLLINPKQSHSTNVSFFSYPGRVMDTDGVFTSDSRLLCSIQVADCLPIYFVHKSDTVFGLVHAGWRGLVNDILSESATVLKNNGNSLIDFDILIGPSIQKCCFEVRDDVISQFDPDFVEGNANGKYRIDLQKMALAQLIESGSQFENITILNDCTYCDTEKYHSYRRNGKKAGRMIGLIGSC